MNQVFVSHSGKSKSDFIVLLKSFLESHSITSIWHDEDRLFAGDNIGEQVKRGIIESACCILLLDEHSSDSSWCTAEASAFWITNKPIIMYPLNDRYEIPPFLAGTKLASSLDDIIRAVETVPLRTPLTRAVVTDSPDIARLMRDIGDLQTKFAELRREGNTDVQTVDETESTLVKAGLEMNKFETLIGTKAIEEAATEIINASRDSDDIVATNQYSSGDLLSDDYMNAMADRVKRAKVENGEMEVHLVMPARTDLISELEDRTSGIFRQKDIQDRLVRSYARHPLPFEVLIVGNSMIIALRSGGNRPTYEVAIRIEDREFVELAAQRLREAMWEETDRDED